MAADPSSDPLSAQLQAIPLFQGLDQATCTDLARRMTQREYAEGEIIFLEGEAAAGLYFVEYGWLKAVRALPEGREHVLRHIGPGEVLNEIGAFAEQPNPATAIALEPSKLWLLPRTSVVKLVRTRPEIAERVIASLAARVVTLVNLVTDLSLRPVAGRLARLLLDSAKSDTLYRPHWYTQAELAARLGTVPDVVQRGLRNLESEGIIQVERQRILILDRAALERLAN